jgi:uncharacterized protein YggT (Ycf19 family)
MNYGVRGTVTAIANVLMTAVIFFLGLRIIFRFFEANPATPFVAWIYEVSGYLMNPFRGIFPQQGTAAGIIEVPAIVALMVYALLVYFVTYIVNSLGTPAYHRDQTHGHVH